MEELKEFLENALTIEQQAETGRAEQAKAAACASFHVQRVNAQSGRGPEGTFVLADKVYKERSGARGTA